MPFAYQLLLFVLAAAYISTLAWILRRLPKRYGKQVLTCPETKSQVDVEVDTQHAMFSQLAGVKDLRLQSCSRWPERADCDQDCLLQIEAAPAVLSRVMARWYEGKSCALCQRPVSIGDWEAGRLALLDQNNTLIELRQIRLEQLPNAFDQCRPLCWTCHQAERARRPAPAVYLKGDRRPRAAKARTLREW